MAHDARGILFGPFRLDGDGTRLWRGNDPVALQPRPLAVLAYLAARPGRVVGRDELIARLWADTVVTKAVLKVAIRAIREAIGDDSDAPRYIETVGREGYRFIGAGDVPAVPRTADGASTMVGRERDLAALHAALARAHAGTRAIVFVSGEAGIGKTTLLDRFVAEVEGASDVHVVRGQCLEQYGEGEPYMPVLEALGALSRSDASGAFDDTLARHAPAWVMHLAGVEAPALERAAGTGPTTPARMLREMADALEVFTRERTVVLVLEDLQWSDRSSVDLLACLARRRQPARLLVVGSLRPGDMRLHDHPLLAVQRELQVKGLCEEVGLALLTRDEVAAYVAARFVGASPAALRRLAARVYERTEGNGLFMVNVLNDLVATNVLVHRDGAWHVDGSVDSAADGIPVGLQELLHRRMRELAPPVRKVLEAASVAGDEFAVAAVAAAVQLAEARIEDVCEQLASQEQLLDDAGVAEWPDGSISGRYRFRHALYRRALYEGVAEARRARMHRAIGRRIEQGFGARAGEHAAELAMHFGRGRSHLRALQFHELAAVAALERHAAHEATAHWTAALDALSHLKGPGHARRELGLVVARATLLMATEGYAAPATEQAFARAGVLCKATPAAPALYPVLRGLLSYHQVRAELATAQSIGEQLLRHAAERPDDRALHVQAHYGVGTNLFHVGELDRAREHLEAALRAYDPETHRYHNVVYGGYDPGVACAMWLAWTLALQGRLDEAATRTRDGLALAQRLGDSFSLAWAYQAVAVSEQLFGDWAASVEAAAHAVRIAEEHGFPHVLGMATINHGWGLVMRGDVAAGIPMLRDGVAIVDATGAGLVRPSYLAMLAGAALVEGDRAACLARFDEGLAEIARSGERLFEPWLRIEKAALLAAGGERGKPTRAAMDAAKACLDRALDVARAQGARLIVLRATVALARWCRDNGRSDEGHAELGAAYAWFAERPRLSSPETVAARRLLAELGRDAR